MLDLVPAGVRAARARAGGGGGACGGGGAARGRRARRGPGVGAGGPGDPRPRRARGTGGRPVTPAHVARQGAAVPGVHLAGLDRWVAAVVVVLAVAVVL